MKNQKLGITGWTMHNLQISSRIVNKIADLERFSPNKLNAETQSREDSKKAEKNQTLFPVCHSTIFLTTLRLGAFASPR